MENSRPDSRRIVQMLLAGETRRIPKGELCIDEEVIRQLVPAEKPGFEQTLSFLQQMQLDIYTLLPCYPAVRKGELPGRKEVAWPDLQRWTADSPYFIFAVLDGAFEWGMRLVGMEKFFGLLRSPAALADLTAQVEKFNLYQIDLLAAEGINGIILADDIAHQQGLFARPELFRKYFIPSLARQVEAVRRFDLPVFYHSDGNYLAVLPDIVDVGFTGLQCLEKGAGMQVDAVRRLAGSYICLWGHLEMQDLERANDPHYLVVLQQETKVFAQGGPFILGTTSGLFVGMKLENLQKLYHSF
ncbi:MAG: hypothetical protein GX167_09645 [Firmicutes bacterium]|jgi:uroporphyrinogen decarboxylase|nr:hypothetical protein [Bacillota bacterium]